MISNIITKQIHAYNHTCTYIYLMKRFKNMQLYSLCGPTTNKFIQGKQKFTNTIVIKLKIVIQ